MPAELAALQRWFQECTVTGRTKGAAREILPSRTLSPGERLEIYSDMYPMRMRDALAADYPAVRALLGPRGFEKLVRAYTEKHPSRHPSLNRLGDHLPDFLARPVKIARRPLVRDVARVELAMTHVFDEARREPLDARRFERVKPDQWGRARLELVPALRLLALEHDVNALVTAARREEPLPRAARCRTWVAVYRKGFTVWRTNLEEPMFLLLSALGRGEPLERAIELSGATDAASISRWFREWRSEGFFADVVFSRAGRGRRA